MIPVRYYAHTYIISRYASHYYSSDVVYYYKVTAIHIFLFKKSESLLDNQYPVLKMFIVFILF